VTRADSAALSLRLILGVVMVAHGWNHWRGGGGVEGTARWFASLGLAPPKVHAWSSVLVETAAGAALIFGVLTPVACAAVVGVMTVAGVCAHRSNGFFVFKDGYEYVLVVAVAALALGLLGPGTASVDDALGLAAPLDGAVGALLALSGAAVAAAMLLVCWRPRTAASR